MNVGEIWGPVELYATKHVELYPQRALTCRGPLLFRLFTTCARRPSRHRVFVRLPRNQSKNSALYWMCIFCLPTSSVLPLHDHPGMTVLSKVIYGSMHVKAYDWVEPAYIQTSREPNQLPVRLAKLVVDKILTAPCGTSVLYPKSGGNIHCFTAVTPCAVLDIITPPYHESAGRKCTYYHDYPYSSFVSGNMTESYKGREESYVWLKEMDTPDDLYMRSGRYAGPPIQL